VSAKNSGGGFGLWANSTDGTAVYGSSTDGMAIVGVSKTQDAINGTSSSTQHAGVSANNNGGGNALWAQASSPGFAGYFNGNVQINGNHQANQ